MKASRKLSLQVTLATGISVVAATVASGQSVWNALNNVSANTNWSTAANWLPAGVPGPATSVQFLNNGVNDTAGVINNVVDSTTAIGSLQYGNTTNFHTTFISPGVTLSNLGNFIGGSETAFTNLNLVTTIVGANAALVVSNLTANVVVREGGGNASGRYTVDMSGLDTFNADVNIVFIGRGDPPGLPSINRATGWLYLAKTNRVRAEVPFTGSLNVIGIEVGRSASNNGNGSRLYLGQENDIFANSLGVAFEKETGCLLAFNPIFSNPNAVIRGADGSSRMSLFTVGDGEANSGTTSCSGAADFTGGTIDAMVDTMTIGRASANTSGSGNSRGTLTMNGGIIDVNNLQIGLQTVNSGKNGNGTVTVNGGTLAVQNDLELAHTTGGAGATATVGTLTVGGGLVEVAGNITEPGGAGTSTLNLNSGTLDLKPAGDSSSGNITVDTLRIGAAGAGLPAIVTNVDTIHCPSVTVGSDGIIAGPASIDIGADGSGLLEVSGVSGGFTLGGTLRGSGNVSGDLIQGAGATLNPSGTTPSLTFMNNLTLGAGTLIYDLADPSIPGGPNATMTVFGNLTLSGTNNLEITPSSGTLSNGTYLLVTYSGGLTGDATYFKAAGTIAQSRHTFTFDVNTPSQINLIVGGSDPVGLQWVGDGIANVWDVNGAANWNNGVTSDKFFSLDSVTFDDGGSASPAVALTGVLAPGSITVSNATKAYTFSGTGNVTGNPALTKSGAATLTIANSAANSFGTITVDAGSLTIANSQPNTYSGDIILDGGSLVLNLTADTVLANALSGTNGALVKQDATTLTLAGTNSAFDGTITVNSGTLKPGNLTAFGSTLGGTLIAGGATLDIADNNINLGLEPISVSGAGVGGNGAIINSSGNNNFVGPNIAFVTLLGDTTFGGTGRWDLRAAGGTAGDPATAGLSTGGNAYNLTKLGSNTVNLVSLTVDTNLANIDIKEGLLSFEGNLTSAGNPTNTITVYSGSTLRFWAITNLFDKVIKLQDGATILNGSGSNTVAGPVQLQGSNTFSVGGTSLKFVNNITGTGGLVKADNDTLILAGLNNAWSGGLVIGDGTLQIGDGGANGSLPVTAVTNNGALVFNSANDLSLSGQVSGTGTLAQNGTGKLTVTGSQLYSGATTVSGGTVQLDGSLLGGGGVTVSGGTLAGTGTIVGGVTVQTGGTLSPGDSIGTLNVVGALSLAGTNLMQLNKSGPTLTNDKINGISSLTLGGTLVLDISGDSLASGDAFPLFSATLILPGSFASIQPATPGSGLIWDTSGLGSGGDGVLRVAAGVVGNPVVTDVHLSLGNLVISGTNGTANADYVVLVSTNLATPFANWTPLVTNQFTAGGAFTFNDPVNLGTPRRFYLIQRPGN